MGDGWCWSLGPQWQSMGFRALSCFAWVGEVIFMWMEEPEV